MPHTRILVLVLMGLTLGLSACVAPNVNLDETKARAHGPGNPVTRGQGR